MWIDIETHETGVYWALNFEKYMGVFVDQA